MWVVSAEVLECSVDIAVENSSADFYFTSAMISATVMEVLTLSVDGVDIVE